MNSCLSDTASTDMHVQSQPKPQSADCDLLKLELSLDSSDLRAHPWYHGGISRPAAEELLESDGDFLVRDRSGASGLGDFVLSCRWDDRNRHFIVQRVIEQEDTIYEKFTYKFEAEGFDTVPDLITYYVGSEKPISIDSGALICRPRNRSLPVAIIKVAEPENSRALSEGTATARCNYVRGHLLEDFRTAMTISGHSHLSLDRKREKSLNLQPPPGLLQELCRIPAEFPTKAISPASEVAKGSNGSNFEQNSPLNITNLISLLLETHERSIALTLTKSDWKVLGPRLYDRLFHDSAYRKQNVLERSLALSQFVVVTTLLAGASTRGTESKSTSELMFIKWSRVAGELKAGLGNFFSFCSIMRGLLSPQLGAGNGKLDWYKLRTKSTDDAVTFDTVYRTAYQNLSKGVESYPPNLTIPELCAPASILEMGGEGLETEPPVKALELKGWMDSEEVQLEYIVNHLNMLRGAAKWALTQEGNMERNLAELDLAPVTPVSDKKLEELLSHEAQVRLVWA